MNRNLTKLLRCYRDQCANQTPKPCWARQSPALPSGVNLHGFFLSETGLGESARLLYQAFLTQDMNVVACNRVLKDRQNETSFLHDVSSNAPYNFSLTVDGLPGFKRLRHQICKNKDNIAYVFWELNSIPAKYIEYLKQYNSIWAPSGFIRETLEKHGFSNVKLVKHPVHLPPKDPQFFNPSGPLRILFYFDFDSYPARKNPEAAIHAFKLAFPDQHNVSLTVKTRGKRDLGRRDWLAKEAAADPRIRVVDQLLSRSEVSDLMSDHDVFLSLHRSEGLGLGCAEALAAGKAVVATDYGGSTEFINERTGYPVRWHPVAVGPDDYILAENATWAEPSIDHAAEILRTIYHDPQTARVRAENGYRNLADQHSLTAVGREMVAVLQEIGLKADDSLISA